MESAVILVFVVGYLCITLEDFIHVNQSAIAEKIVILTLDSTSDRSPQSIQQGQPALKQTHSTRTVMLSASKRFFKKACRR